MLSSCLCLFCSCVLHPLLSSSTSSSTFFYVLNVLHPACSVLRTLFPVSRHALNMLIRQSSRVAVKYQPKWCSGDQFRDRKWRFTSSYTLKHVIVHISVAGTSCLISCTSLFHHEKLKLFFN